MRRARVLFAITAIVCVSAASADERVIGFHGQPNFRDIGGYATSDGREIRSGLIYRSGELPRLTDNDVKKLQALGVKTVVNFLTPNEIAYRGKDRLPAGVREISLPITGEIADVPDATAQLVDARKTGDFRKFPPAFNPQVHNDLVSGLADDQYRALFDILADDFELSAGLPLLARRAPNRNSDSAFAERAERPLGNSARGLFAVECHAEIGGRAPH